MPRFFDRLKKTSNNRIGQEGSDEIKKADEIKKVDENRLAFVKLRRTLAQCDVSQGKTYRSKEDFSIHKGLYDLQDPSNRDLVPIEPEA